MGSTRQSGQELARGRESGDMRLYLSKKERVNICSHIKRETLKKNLTF